MIISVLARILLSGIALVAVPFLHYYSRGVKLETASVMRTIRISPHNISNDDMVTVSYFSSNPSANDWVAAYSPPNVDIKTTVPVKYAWMNSDPKYLNTSHGMVRFNMTNLRQGVKFYFMTNGLKKFVVGNSSSDGTILSFKAPNEPLRPRVVASGNPDVFLVLWSSYNSKQPVLKWRSSPTGAYTTVAASSDTIKSDDLCGYPANSTGFFNTGLIHTAKMSGMRALAGSIVHYTFGDAATNLFYHGSGDIKLRVPPLGGTQPIGRPTTVVLYASMGIGSNDDAPTWNPIGPQAYNTAMSVGSLVLDGMVDAVFHGGDISYAVGYLAKWDFFLNMISPVASGALYLTTVGNHDSDWPGKSTYYTGRDSGGECGVAALKNFPQPSPIDIAQPWVKPWWSYDVGLIHFVGMSTEHNFTIGSPQYAFLENDLRDVNRTKSPFIILGGHRPMYTNSNWGGVVGSDIEVMNALIANVEPLLLKYKVNLAFWGHDHNVQRQSAVYQKQVVHASTLEHVEGHPTHVFSNPQATVHMVVGTAGAPFTENSVNPGPPWNELVMYEWGYALVKVHNASHLEWNWINSVNDTVMDRMLITQDATQLSSPWPCPVGASCSSVSPATPTNPAFPAPTTDPTDGSKQAPRSTQEEVVSLVIGISSVLANVVALALGLVAGVGVIFLRRSACHEFNIVPLPAVDVIFSITMAVLQVVSNVMQVAGGNSQSSAAIVCIAIVRFIMLAVTVRVVFRSLYRKALSRFVVGACFHNPTVWIVIAALALLDPSILRFFCWKHSEFAMRSGGFPTMSVFYATLLSTAASSFIMTVLSASDYFYSYQGQTSFAISFVSFLAAIITILFRLRAEKIHMINVFIVDDDRLIVVREDGVFENDRRVTDAERALDLTRQELENQRLKAEEIAAEKSCVDQEIKELREERAKMAHSLAQRSSLDFRPESNCPRAVAATVAVVQDAIITVVEKAPSVVDQIPTASTAYKAAFQGPAETESRAFSTNVPYAEENLSVLKDQLKDAGKRPLEYIPLADLTAELSSIMAKVNAAEPYDERRLDHLLACLDINPQYRAEKEAERKAWKAKIAPFCTECLALQRDYTPPHIFSASFIGLCDEGVPVALAKRLMAKPCLWLVRMKQTEILRLHEVELTNRYGSEGQGLDVVEMAALYACLSSEKGVPNDPSGKKRAYVSRLEDGLKSAMTAHDQGKLLPGKQRAACYVDSQPLYSHRNSLLESLLGATEKLRGSLRHRSEGERSSSCRKSNSGSSPSEKCGVELPAQDSGELKASPRISPAGRPTASTHEVTNPIHDKERKAGGEERATNIDTSFKTKRDSVKAALESTLGARRLRPDKL